MKRLRTLKKVALLGAALGMMALPAAAVEFNHDYGTATGTVTKWEYNVATVKGTYRAFSTYPNKNRGLYPQGRVSVKIWGWASWTRLTDTNATRGQSKTLASTAVRYNSATPSDTNKVGFRLCDDVPLWADDCGKAATVNR
ncbi:MAG TPA: hypothetical protein PKE42_06710 [Arachnia sp.]|jgi:hypothetical protein|nr:hypothetical protein [Arachnia sp.]